MRPSDLSPYTTSYQLQHRENEEKDGHSCIDSNQPGAAQPQSSASPDSSLVARDQGKPHSHSQRLSVLDSLTVADNFTTDATTVDSPSTSAAAPGPSTSSSPASPTSPLTQEFPPLYTSNVLPGTKIAHPKPIALPASGSSTPLPTKPHAKSDPRRPEQSIRNSAFVGNVAQLEATAERLSTGTSSIGDAIKDLHGELKRSDSRRSSMLAASLRAQNDDTQAPPEAPAVGQLKRHLSNSSSIVATNSAARHGGYSPGAFVMSPNHSLTGRLRSGSKNSSGQPDLDIVTGLSRHGPGKASVRSVRSTKLSLAEISESEPTALNKDALDAADAAPPIDVDDTDNEHDDTLRPDELQPGSEAGTDAFHQMLDQSAEATAGHLAGTVQRQHSQAARPARSNSVNTFQQAQEAFIDFDGTHWEPESDPEPEIQHDQRHIHFEEPMNLDLSMPHEQDFPTPHVSPNDMPRPQSYFDHETGQQMLYYPARVPAMINLPPKLSNKPKAAQHQNRRSKVLNAMVDSNKHSEEAAARRKSGMPDPSRESWLPDPLAGHRGSFIALSQESPPADETRSEEQAQPETPTEHVGLRKPQRLSRTEPEKREDRASRLDKLPPQLRASAFFDLPSSAPEVEVKEGSAMATLDSMLDASTTAPVSAFTNHSFAGTLGPEVYGKQRKHKSKVSTSSLKPEDAIKNEKRTSRSWFKRGSSHNSEERVASTSRSRSPSALGDAHGDTDVSEVQGLTSEVDGQSIRQPEDGESEADSEEDVDYNGQPTTLLAELQLRKQQQRQRTAPRAHGQGSYMTLLEMDAVAETQRKQRQNKRVNLAWEDPNAHLDQNGSDDEDIPLAIIAAKHAGAKNMADLERPIGLMEQREIEDNEPLSHRRARLQGVQPPPTLGLPKRQSIAGLSTHLGAGHVRTPSSQPPRSQAVTPEPAEPELEEETLGARKKRLEAKELPQARPVSSSFSAELLSQFGDLDDVKDKEKPKAPSPAGDEEEETLGQRRRRLQAEREAREREMSYSNLTGQPAVSRRLSMADMLAAHPKKEADNRAQQAQQRAQQEQFAAQARESRMAAMRMQMPQALQTPGINRAGGFGGGIYNDGFGGQAVQSTSALNTQGATRVPRHNRSTTALSAYGMPMQQSGYAPGMQGGMGNMGSMNPYARASMQFPQGMNMGMMEAPQPMSVNSMKRVDQWRHGVMP